MLSRWVTCHRVVATFAACSCGWMNWIRMNSAPAATAASPAACSNALGVMVGRDQLIALLLRLRVEKGGYRRLGAGTAFDAGHRDQRQAGVAHLLQQPVQRCLVDDRTLEQAGAIAAAGQSQPVEPPRPPVGQVTLDPDLELPGVERPWSRRS